MIRIKDFTFYYSDAEKPALDGINLEIRDGEFVLVTGPSGGGKSSLCRCFNGLIPHFYGGRVSGSVEVQGVDILRHPAKELATKVGMVFQDPENQMVATDVEREVAFGLENLAVPRDVIAKRIEESLYTLGISELRHRELNGLSGGEKQKVAIASVLALHPDILVLDEPTSELDPKSAEEVLSLVQRLNDELGITVILIEHRLDRVVQHVDRLVVLADGKIIADGGIREVLGKSYNVVAGVGVGMPPVIRLTHELETRGVYLNGMPLTVKEGRLKLDKVFQKTSGKLPERVSGTERINGKPLIEVDRLSFAYVDGNTALKNASLQIGRGEFVAVMGRNAAGKTTLVKHFIGLLKPTRGMVKIDGVDTRKVTVSELARKVGFVFQNPNDHIFADTVEEEISFVLKNRGVSSAEIKNRVDMMLERFDLMAYRKQYPRSLSGGEKQRVALASVLVSEPLVLILDEPTRGMEYGLKADLMKLLDEYRRQGNTVILVTHDVETAAEYADRVILLSGGEIVVDGDKRDVLSRALLFSPQINRLVQAFRKYGVPDSVLTVNEALQILK